MSSIFLVYSDMSTESNWPCFFTTSIANYIFKDLTLLDFQTDRFQIHLSFQVVCSRDCSLFEIKAVIPTTRSATAR